MFLVFKILELESPKHITMDWILVAPRSTLQLKANLDDVIYKLDSDSTGIVKVSTDGVIRTQDTLGRDLIIVSCFRFFICILMDLLTSIPSTAGQNLRTNPTNWR